MTEPVVNAVLRPKEVGTNHHFDIVRQVINQINEQLRMRSYVSEEFEHEGKKLRIYQLTIPHFTMHDIKDDVLKEIIRSIKKSGWMGFQLSLQDHPIRLGSVGYDPGNGSTTIRPGKASSIFSTPLIVLTELLE
jgi:hypothetical protein